MFESCPSSLDRSGSDVASVCLCYVYSDSDVTGVSVEVVECSVCEYSVLYVVRLDVEELKSADGCVAATLETCVVSDVRCDVGPPGSDVLSDEGGSGSLLSVSIGSAMLSIAVNVLIRVHVPSITVVVNSTCYRVLFE